MTTTKPDVINYCPECEVEYPGHRCDRCPLCPLRAAWSETANALRSVEPWRIITGTGHLQVQELINEMSASGWTRDSFHVSQEQEQGGVRPVYVALMRRMPYDQESHALRRMAHQKAVDEYFAKQDDMEAGVKVFRAERDREQS